MGEDIRSLCVFGFGLLDPVSFDHSATFQMESAERVLGVERDCEMVMMGLW